MHYQKLKDGWDKAANTNPNGAIHPAGNSSQEDYKASGIADVNKLLTVMQTQGIGPEHLTKLAIIDYGCGNGRMTNILATLFNTVYAVDVSYGMLQQLLQHQNVYPILVNENVFIVPGEPADVAVSVSVFIHNTYQDGKQILKEISDNLALGGHAFLQIPIYDELREPSDWTDVGVWTEIDLYNAATEADMEVVQCFSNPGVFSFDTVGPNHAQFQILRKVDSPDF